MQQEFEQGLVKKPSQNGVNNHKNSEYILASEDGSRVFDTFNELI